METGAAPYIGPDLIAEVGRQLMWPPVSIGSFSIGADDEEAWNAMAGRASQADLGEWLVALTGELMSSTPGGRARLASSPSGDLDDDVRPLVLGSTTAAGIVEQALALLPAAVRACAARELAFVAVGFDRVRAWTSSARFLGSDGHTKTRLVALSASADLRVVLHEVAHCHLSDLPSEFSMALSARAEDALQALAIGQGWADQVEDHIRREESLAEALSLAWLLGRPTGAIS
jgi:hypothetical protein